MRNLKSIYITVILLFAFTLNYDCSRQSDTQSEPSASASAGDTLNIVPQLIRAQSSIRYGETLSTIFRKHGIDQSTNYAMCQEFSKIYNLRHLKPRQEYIIERDSTDSLVKFVFKPTIEEQYSVTYNNGSVTRSGFDTAFHSPKGTTVGTECGGLHGRLVATHHLPTSAGLLQGNRRNVCCCP